MIRPDPSPALSSLSTILFDWARRVYQLWGLHQVFTTTAPVLADMQVGEIAIGNGTEAAGANGLYAKSSKTKIDVYAVSRTIT